MEFHSKLACMLHSAAAENNVYCENTEYGWFLTDKALQKRI
jgi:hypothetical protein